MSVLYGCYPSMPKTVELRFSRGSNAPGANFLAKIKISRNCLQNAWWTEWILLWYSLGHGTPDESLLLTNPKNKATGQTQPSLWASSRPILKIRPLSSLWTPNSCSNYCALWFPSVPREQTLLPSRTRAVVAASLEFHGLKLCITTFEFQEP